MRQLSNSIKYLITCPSASIILWAIMWILYSQINLDAYVDPTTFQYIIFLLIGTIVLSMAIKLHRASLASKAESPSSERLQKIENQMGFFKEELTAMQNKIGDIHTVTKLAPEPPKPPETTSHAPVEAKEDKKTEDKIKKLYDKITAMEKTQKDKDAEHEKTEKELEAAKQKLKKAQDFFT